MDLVAEPGQAGGSITQDTQTRGRSAREPDKKGQLPDITVGSVTLKNGRMTFTDRFVKPNYTAELSRIEGGLSAVSSRNPKPAKVKVTGRSEEHTSELQSLMRTSYAVFCLKNKKQR